MRSENEQQNLTETQAYRELRLLDQVDENPDVTQRQLSLGIGVALGLTNVLLKNLVQKGYIKVNQATWKRRLYTLTPDGFSRRFRLMTSYVRKVLDHYQSVRQTLRDQLEPLALNEESKVAIFGTDEFAELVYLGLKELCIEEIQVFDAKAEEGRRFLGTPIRNMRSFRADDYDKVIIGFMEPDSKIIEAFREANVSSEQLVVFFSDANSGKRL